MGKLDTTQKYNSYDKLVDEDEKVKVNNVYVEGRNGGNGVWFLTEDGLYEVLMQSRKPIAKAFRKEVKQNIKSYRFKRCLSDKQQLKGIVDTDTLTKMGYAKQILMNLNLGLIF